MTTNPSVTRAPEVGPDPRRWKALSVLALVQLMLLLDATVVNVALPTIKSDLGFSDSGLTWVVSSYLLAAGGLLLLGGKVADLIGRRRTFCLGTIVFAGASLLAGAAQSPAMLIAGRVLQGVGEGLAAPAALSMVALLFTSDEERPKAFGIWGGLAGLGSTLGVILSGVLVSAASWRWVFYINLVVAALALAAISRVTDESRAPRGKRLDVPGAVLVTGGLVALIHGLLASATQPWTSGAVAVPLVIAVAALAGFVAVERRVSQPLLPLSFFNSRTRAIGYITVVANASASAAVFFVLVLYMQGTLGYSALQAGLAWLPFCLAFMPGLFASMRLMGKRGLRVTLFTGLALSAAGVSLMARLPVDGSYLQDVLPAMIVTSLGFAITAPAMQNAATSDLSSADAGIGSGVVTTVQQLGQALGLAVLVSVAVARTSSQQAAGVGDVVARTAGYRLAFAVAAAVLAVGAVAGPLLVRRGRTAPTAEEATVADTFPAETSPSGPRQTIDAPS